MAEVRAERGITVVTGLPRSGTSLVMQMLAAGGMPVLCDDARPADADNPRGYFESAAVKASARDVSWLAEAEGRAVKVISHLLRHLPERGSGGYRVVLVRRNLTEVLASQRVMLRRRGLEPSPGEDARLAALFARELAELPARLDARVDVTWICVEYGQLLREPAAEACRLAQHLGAALDASAMARCVDPALHRQRADTASE